jgi:hypothetical protein
MAMSKPTASELAGRAAWREHALATARAEGRAISVAERAVMDRYVAGEISGDEAREAILRLFETPELS